MLKVVINLIKSIIKLCYFIKHGGGLWLVKMIVEECLDLNFIEFTCSWYGLIILFLFCDDEKLTSLTFSFQLYDFFLLVFFIVFFFGV